MPRHASAVFLPQNSSWNRCRTSLQGCSCVGVPLLEDMSRKTAEEMKRNKKKRVKEEGAHLLLAVWVHGIYLKRLKTANNLFFLLFFFLSTGAIVTRWPPIRRLKTCRRQPANSGVPAWGKFGFVDCSVPFVLVSLPSVLAPICVPWYSPSLFRLPKISPGCRPKSPFCAPRLRLEAQPHG